MAHLRPACEQSCIPGRLWPVPASQDLSSDQLTLAACEGLAFLGGPKDTQPAHLLLSPFGQPPPQQPEAILEGRARNRLARVVSRFFPPSVWAGGWGALLGPKPPRTDAPEGPRGAQASKGASRAAVSRASPVGSGVPRLPTDSVRAASWCSCRRVAAGSLVPPTRPAGGQPALAAAVPNCSSSAALQQLCQLILAWLNASTKEQPPMCQGRGASSPGEQRASPPEERAAQLSWACTGAIHLVNLTRPHTRVPYSSVVQTSTIHSRWCRP